MVTGSAEPRWTGGRAVAVEDIDGALSVLGRDMRPGDVVIVKASRSIGLEKLAQQLIADRGGEDPVANT